MVRKWWIVWPLFAAIMGFALGGTFVSAFDNQIADSRHAEAEQKTDPEKLWWIRAFSDPNFFIAIFTGCLVVTAFVQNKALNRANAVAKKAADAAMLNARAAIGLELPIVRCAPPNVLGSSNVFARGGIGVSNLVTHNFHKVSHLEFRNRGKTPFYPYEVGLGWLITEQPAVEFEQLPPEPVYTNIHGVSGETVISEYFGFSTHDTFVLRTEDPAFKNELNNGAKNVRVLAYIKYRDFMEQDHETRFCWRWVGGSRDGTLPPGMIADDHVPESYTRKI